MDGFAFYLDGQVIDAPGRFDEFTEELVRDEVKRHVYFTFPLELDFYGLAYDILESQYQSNYNASVEFVVLDLRSGLPQKIISSVIKMSACEWNLTRKICTCNIDDASYQASIFSSLKTEIFPSVTETNDGTAMDGAPVVDLILFNPQNGNYSAFNRIAFDVYDCMEALITFVSNGTVKFESTWYDNLPDDEKLCIIQGSVLRNPDRTDQPLISLDRLFEELWKKFNLYLIIENPLISPICRLEEESYLETDTEQIIVNDLKDLRRSIDVERLYSRVLLGSLEYDRSYGAEYLFPYFQFFGFSEESYSVSGVIGVDNDLDLQSRYIIDTNSIERSAVIGDNNWDDDTFLIQYTQSTGQATKCFYYDTGSGDNSLYNEQLLNSNVANRFNYYGDLVLSSGLLESNFQASRTSTTEITRSMSNGDIEQFIQELPYPYEDDSTPPNFDDGDNYDNTTFQYTAPSNGVFRFEASYSTRVLEITQTGTAPNAFTYFPDIRFYLNGATQIFVDQYVVTTTTPSGDTYTTVIPSGGSIADTAPTYDPNYSFNFSTQRSIELNQGDTIEVHARLSIQTGLTPGNPTTWTYKLRSFNGIFKTIVTPGTGGSYEPATPDAVQIVLYENEQQLLTAEQWQAIRIRPTSQIVIDTGNNDPRRTYIKRITHELVTGQTDFELTSDRLQPHI